MKTMSLGTRALLVMSVLFGLVFAVGAGVMWYLDVSVWFAIAFALVVTGLQYLIAPFIMEWVFTIEWVQPEQVGPGFAQWLYATCQHRRMPVPRIGIIRDGRPNAFTFGHHPGDARVVFTEGLLTLLSEQEAQAVVAHELGHIKNLDFIVMTVASAVPLVLYMLYVFARRGSGRRGQYAWLVAAGAYVAYMVSQYVVLLLSRVREYTADEFSARTTQNPNALSSALVTIAYGLARIQPDAQASPAPPIPSPYPGAPAHQPKPKPAKGPMDWGGAMAPLGVANSAMAMPFAAATCDASGNFSLENMQRAMRWELVNPWARFYEIASTHPLVARRIQALQRYCRMAGQPCAFSVGDTAGDRYNGSFLAELGLTVLPYAGMAVGAAIAAAAFAGPHDPSSLNGFGWIALLGGLGWLVRLIFEYPGGFRRSNLISLLANVDVSHMRSEPIEMSGRVIGRGVPGLFYSKDLVLQDADGFITLNYRQPLGIWEFLFGACKAERFVGRLATVRGWYRRSPMPFVEIQQIQIDGEGPIRCYHYPAKYVGAILAIGLGLFLVFAAKF